MSPNSITLIPRISEKSFAQVSKQNTYVFDVDTVFNKQQIKEAVAEQFKVEVTKVNTVVAKGKVKGTFTRTGGKKEGARKSVKRAYVTLKKGDSIPIFEEAN